MKNTGRFNRKNFARILRKFRNIIVLNILPAATFVCGRSTSISTFIRRVWWTWIMNVNTISVRPVTAFSSFISCNLSDLVNSWVRETRDPGLTMPLCLAVDIYFISVTLVAGRGNFKPSVSILQEISLSLVIIAI